MTAHLATRSFPAASTVHGSCEHKSMGSSEMSFRKFGGALSPQDAERAWFKGLLWKAFPDATSDNDLAEKAAETLTREGRPVEARTVKNWLGCNNTPHFRYVLIVIGLAGIESIFQIIDPERCQ